MPDSNNVIDLGKFRSFHEQLSSIQLVVDKLLTKQNASVYNKILFTVISSNDYYKLKEGIKVIDANAFIAITDTYDVVSRSV